MQTEWTVRGTVSKEAKEAAMRVKGRPITVGEERRGNEDSRVEVLKWKQVPDTAMPWRLNM